MPRGVKGVEIVALGLVFLIANLLFRHVPAIHSDLLIVATGWIGAILVVVGIGAAVFLED
jgi:hypothetical protein